MNSEIKKIANWAQSQGWTVEDDTKGYTHFCDPDGNHKGYYPATPSRPYRRMKQLEVDLRAAGLQIPPPSKKEQRAKQRKQQQRKDQGND